MAAEIPDGAVLVARAVLNSSLWTMRAEDRVVAMTCICLANWQPKKWFDGTKDMVIERGQFVRSWEDFAEACGLSLQKTRTSVKHLEKVGFLTRKPTGHYTLYTIPKYDFYQNLANYSDSRASDLTRNLTGNQQAPNRSLTATQQAPNNKQEREELEEREEGEEGAPAPVEKAPILPGLTPEARIVTQFNRNGGCPISLERGEAHIRAAVARGASLRAIDEASMSAASCGGKKIWEFIDPFCPSREKQDDAEFVRRRDAAIPKI